MDTDIYKELYKEMNSSERFYFENRLDSQIKWYDTKSISTHKKYKRVKFIILLCSSLIPFLVVISESKICLKIFIGLLGVLITSLEGLSNINKYQEHWLEYRSICETLQHEKHMYLYKSGIYSEPENRFTFFVERIESIISKENINWANLNKNESGDVKNG
ncbi:MAG: DUF4231 domain-containing protein [Tissierella sp.]|nr:DUF4231 domain-containing protein [Tissierella sp.]